MDRARLHFDPLVCLWAVWRHLGVAGDEVDVRAQEFAERGVLLASRCVFQTSLSSEKCDKKLAVCLDNFGIHSANNFVFRECRDLIAAARMKRAVPTAPTTDSAGKVLPYEVQPMQWSAILSSTHQSIMTPEMIRSAQNIRVYLRKYCNAVLPKPGAAHVFECLAGRDKIEARKKNTTAQELA